MCLYRAGQKTILVTKKMSVTIYIHLAFAQVKTQVCNGESNGIVDCTWYHKDSNCRLILACDSEIKLLVMQLCVDMVIDKNSQSVYHCNVAIPEDCRRQGNQV